LFQIFIILIEIIGKIPWRRKWQPTPVFSPGKFHRWRSLVGYSPWGWKSWTPLSDFTFHFTSHQFLAWLGISGENTGVGCHFLLQGIFPMISIKVMKIWNKDNTKCRWGCAATETLIHCWWEGKMVQSPWKTDCWFHIALNVLLPYDPATSSLVFTQISWNLIPIKTPTHDVHSIFIHNCPKLEIVTIPVSRWMNKLWQSDKWMLLST